MKVLVTILGCAAALLTGACSTGRPAPEPAFDPQFARAVNDTATQAAVAKPGAKVCRTIQVGIAERDWIRGVVSEIADSKLAVRIDDAGRFPHELNGTAVVRGALVWDTATGWTPCLF